LKRIRVPRMVHVPRAEYQWR